MKCKIIPQLLAAAVLVFSQCLVAPVPARAQAEEPDPWGHVFDADGNLLPSVVDLGEVELDPAPEWWPTGWFQELIGFSPTYHQYVTPEGEVVIVPSASTLFLMTLNPTDSGLLNAWGYTGNAVGGVLINIMLATENGQGLLDRINEFGYADPNAFADAVISGEIDIWSFGGPDILNMMAELYQISCEDFMFATTYLLYLQDTCSGSPTGCPENLCQIAPLVCQDEDDNQIPDPLPECPGAALQIGAPLIQIYPAAPVSPLVVGQDPDRRGVDVQLEVTIPPTRYEYYTATPVWEEVETCLVPDGAAAGALNCKTDPALPANNGRLQVHQELVDIVCEQHVLIYAEPISGVVAGARLSAESQDWIQQDLGAYYYGAAVYQANHNLVPGLAGANTACDSQQICRATAFIHRVQLRDPGRYALVVEVQTAGTPLTAGRLLRGSGEVSVSLLSVRLIDPLP